MTDFKGYDQDGNLISMPWKAYGELARGYPPADSSRRPVQMLAVLLGVVVLLLIGSLVYGVVVNL